MANDDPLKPSDPLQAMHDALAAVRQSGAYYGGWPQVPGPAVLSGMRPTNAAVGIPKMSGPRVEKMISAKSPQSIEPANIHVPSDREAVLSKLIANRDFQPLIQQGRIYFRSLSPSENKTMQRIGWGRAPDVHPTEETDPLTSKEAWERNIRYWLELAAPPK